MRFSVTAGLLVAGLAIPGCLMQPADPEPPAEKIDSAILLSMSETLPGRSLILPSRTAREYPCCNFGLNAEWQHSSSGFQVRFGSITVPEICLTSPGPALARLELGRLEPGPYSFEAVANGDPFRGALEVTPESYRIVGRATAGVGFGENVLRRIPEGAAWGYFGYARADLQPTVRSILRDIQSLGATPLALADGRYSVVMSQSGDEFHVRSGDIVRDGTGYWFTSSFALDFGGDLDALRRIVARTGAAHGDLVHLVVYTAQGDVMYSWVLGRQG